MSIIESLAYLILKSHKHQNLMAVIYLLLKLKDSVLHGSNIFSSYAINQNYF